MAPPRRRPRHRAPARRLARLAAVPGTGHARHVCRQRHAGRAPALLLHEPRLRGYVRGRAGEGRDLRLDPRVPEQPPVAGHVLLQQHQRAGWLEDRALRIENGVETELAVSGPFHKTYVARSVAWSSLVAPC